jgi:hypothetical protein
MSIQTTRQSLGIFWDGEEVDGITVYGLWKEPPQTFPSLSHLLGKEGLRERQSELRGESWYVRVWDIKIEIWPPPDQWKKRIHNMLRAIIECGSVVAWCGLEGAFIDPPELFDPQYMAGGVWAAMTNDGLLYSCAELDGVFTKLSNDDLHAIENTISKK